MERTGKKDGDESCPEGEIESVYVHDRWLDGFGRHKLRNLDGSGARQRDMDVLSRVPPAADYRIHHGAGDSQFGDLRVPESDNGRRMPAWCFCMAGGGSRCCVEDGARLIRVEG